MSAPEGVPDLMTHFPAHFHLLSLYNLSERAIDHGILKYVDLFVRGAAAQSLALSLAYP